MTSKLIIDIFSYFTDIYKPYCSHSFFGKLVNNQKLAFNFYNFYNYSRLLKHKKIDSKPFGGGNGCILRYNFIYDLLMHVYGNNLPFIIHPSPSGYLLDQKKINELSSLENICFINSRYEGIDARVIESFNVFEISIGDYILYDGDTASLVILNSIIRNRFIKPKAKICESYSNNLLEHDQYTKPYSYQLKTVPDILLSGNHEKIESWKLQNSISKTKLKRPDIYVKYNKNKKI